MNELGMVVVLAICHKTGQFFGVSYKQVTPGEWIVYWAFPISETVSKTEGYDKTTIRGNIIYDPKYPGCPYCHSTGHVRCVCGQLGCWNGESSQYHCLSCGNTAQISGTITEVSGSSDA